MSYTEAITALTEYANRTKQILDLSSPQVADIEDADQYRQVLLDAFEEIGKLAKETHIIMIAEKYI